MVQCKSCGTQFATNNDIVNRGNRIRVCEDRNLWFNCPCGSTFFIQAGDFDWFSPTLLMGHEARKVYSQNDLSNKIPCIHTRIMNLQKVIEDPSSTFRTIKDELEQSPGLALLTLKIASGMAQQGSELTDIEHAVALLGRNTLSGILLSASLVNLPLKTKTYRVSAHWKRALMIGQAAREVFARYGFEDDNKNEPTHPYLLGCFVNIGKLLAAICFPEKVDELVMLMSRPKVETSWNETANFLGLPNEYVLGEVAVAMWGLPQNLANMFHYFRDRHPLPSNSKKLHIFECIELATIIDHWVRLKPHEINDEALKMIQNKLLLGDDQLESLIKTFAPSRKKIELIDDSLFA
ncbi:MAG: HDOD domain-containing protein [Oligoflexales bacterium]